MSFLLYQYMCIAINLQLVELEKKKSRKTQRDRILDSIEKKLKNRIEQAELVLSKEEIALKIEEEKLEISEKVLEIIEKELYKNIKELSKDIKD
ncbi:hypothetical protein K6025_03405 [Ehrlichia sp. JZT12]